MQLLEKFDELIEEESDYQTLEGIINEIRDLESTDGSSSISNLVNDLIIRLEAYKFDREHEKNH